MAIPDATHLRFNRTRDPANNWFNVQCWIGASNPAGYLPNATTDVFLNNAAINVNLVSGNASCKNCYPGATTGDSLTGTGQMTINGEAVNPRNFSCNGNLYLGTSGAILSGQPAVAVNLTVAGNIYDNPTAVYGLICNSDNADFHIYATSIFGNSTTATVFCDKSANVSIGANLFPTQGIDGSAVGGTTVLFYNGNLAILDPSLIYGGNNSSFPYYGIWFGSTGDLTIYGSLYAGNPGCSAGNVEYGSLAVYCVQANSFNMYNGTIQGSNSHNEVPAISFNNQMNNNITFGTSDYPCYIFGGQNPGSDGSPGVHIAGLVGYMQVYGGIAAGTGGNSAGCFINYTGSGNSLYIQGYVHGNSASSMASPGIFISGQGMPDLYINRLAVGDSLRASENGNFWGAAIGELSDSHNVGSAIFFNNSQGMNIFSSGLSVEDSFESPAVYANGYLLFIPHGDANTYWRMPDKDGIPHDLGIVSTGEGALISGSWLDPQPCGTENGNYFAPHANNVLAPAAGGTMYGNNMNTAGTLRASDVFAGFGASAANLRAGKTVDNVVGTLNVTGGHLEGIVQDVVL